MKKVLIGLCVLISVNVFGQVPGYTKINARYNWTAGIFDTSLHVPRYNGTPSGLRVGAYIADGAVAVDTLNHRWYFYSGGAWVRGANYSEIGSTYTFPYSVVAPGNAVQLENDTTGSPANYFYGRNSAGRRGWYPQSSIVGATPTLQQVLTAGSTLTTDNTIDADNNNLTITNIFEGLIQGSFGSSIEIKVPTTSRESGLGITGNDASLYAAKTGHISSILVNVDSISIQAPLGNLKIDTLKNRTTQNAIMGWDSTGSDRGEVGYLTPGYGITIGSGNVRADTATLFPAVRATISGGGGGATVGTYSTRIGLSPSNGNEFFQTDIGRDAPDGKYYYLNSKWHYQPIRPETLTTFWNEFQSITTNQGYLDNGLIGWSGNSGTISFPSAPTLPGVAVFNTSTTTNGYAGFYGGAINNSGAWVMFDKGNCYFKTYINIPTLSDGTDTYSFRIGIGNGLLGDFSNGVYFEYSSATSANWLIKTANYTTRTTTTSSTAVTTGWHTLEILSNSNGTSVEYWVDGTSLGTITTNIPGSGNAQNPIMIMQKSAGTNSRRIEVDYVKAWQRLATQRD